MTDEPDKPSAALSSKRLREALRHLEEIYSDKEENERLLDKFEQENHEILESLLGKLPEPTRDALMKSAAKSAFRDLYDAKPFLDLLEKNKRAS